MAYSARTIILPVGAVLLFLTTLYYLFQPRPYTSDDQSVMGSFFSASSESGLDVFAEDWKEYKPATGSFTALLPTLPQHASEVVPIPDSSDSIKYNMYLTQSKSGLTYMINMIEYPRSFDTSNSEMLLEGIIKEMMSGDAQNVLVDKSRQEFLGCPSVDFTLKTEHGSVSARALIAGKTVYVLTAIDSSSERAKKGFQRLVDGFSLKQNQG